MNHMQTPWRMDCQQQTHYRLSHLPRGGRTGFPLSQESFYPNYWKVRWWECCVSSLRSIADSNHLWHTQNMSMSQPECTNLPIAPTNTLIHVICVLMHAYRYIGTSLTKYNCMYTYVGNRGPFQWDSNWSSKWNDSDTSVSYCVWNLKRPGSVEIRIQY